MTNQEQIQEGNPGDWYTKYDGNPSNIPSNFASGELTSAEIEATNKIIYDFLFNRDELPQQPNTHAFLDFARARAPQVLRHYSGIEARLRDAETAKTKAENSFGEYKAKYTHSDDEYKRVESQITSAKSAIELLSKRIEDQLICLGEQGKRADTARTELQAKLSRLETELSEARQEKTDAEKNFNDYKANHNHEDSEHKTLKSRAEDAERELNGYEGGLTAEEAKDLRKEIEQKKDYIDPTERNICGLGYVPRNKFEEMRERAEGAEKDLNKKDKILQGYEGINPHLESLGQDLSDCSKYVDSLKQSLTPATPTETPVSTVPQIMPIEVLNPTAPAETPIVAPAPVLLAGPNPAEPAPVAPALPAPNPVKKGFFARLFRR